MNRVPNQYPQEIPADEESPHLHAFFNDGYKADQFYFPFPPFAPQQSQGPYQFDPFLYSYRPSGFFQPPDLFSPPDYPPSFSQKNIKKDRKRDGEKAHKPRYRIYGPYPLPSGPFGPIPPQGFPPGFFGPQGFPFPPFTDMNHNPKPKCDGEKAHKPRYRVYGPYPLPSGPFGPIPPQVFPFPPFTEINHNPKPKRDGEKAHKPRYRVYGPYPLLPGPFGPIPPQGCSPGFFGPQGFPFPPFTDLNHNPKPKHDDENPFQPPFFFSGHYPIPEYPVPMQNS